jgi:hypothetical protein
MTKRQASRLLIRASGRADTASNHPRFDTGEKGRQAFRDYQDASALLWQWGHLLLSLRRELALVED